jgi:hypothetical protein
MTEVTSATGIPVEYLFSALGILVAALYVDMRRGIYKLQTGAIKRDRLLVLICDKLNIRFNLGDD